MKHIAIIFAGGTGSRMESELPKQLMQINEKPIICHTVDLFENHPEIDEIYIAFNPDFLEDMLALNEKYQYQKVKAIVPGGKNSQDSVYVALQAAKKENGNENAIVLMHDGVRPFVSPEVITSCIQTAKEKGNAITCNPSYETPVISHNMAVIEDIIPRDRVFMAQAPQAFPMADLIAAHETIRRESGDAYEGIIDSASLMKSLGAELNIVIGNFGNIKITTPIDYHTAILYTTLFDTDGFHLR